MVNYKTNTKINPDTIELLCVIVVISSMALASFIGGIHNVIAGNLMILSSLCGYLILAYVRQNLFDFIGLLFIGFVAPMGAAHFRLASYQEPWTATTWICFIGAVMFFYIGYSLKGKIVDVIEKFDICRYKLSKINVDKTFRCEAIFWLAVFTFFLMLTGFFIKWWVAGSLPLFKWTYSQTYVDYLSGEIYMKALRTKLAGTPGIFIFIKAYHRFSTIFMFQGWLASCLALYYDRKYAKNLWKKIICWAIISFSVIMPIIIVCREILMMNTVCIAVAGFFICKKKKVIFVICMVIVTMISFYVSTQARGYNSESIGEVFQMNKPSENKPSENKPSENKPNQGGTEGITEEKPYPGIVTWVYTYFTCGYDNFNHLTKSLDFRYYGLMQLRPIFAGLQIDSLKDIDMVLQDNKYRVSPNITTYTFLSDAYVDFGVVGVMVSLFIWGAVFGSISEFFRRKNSIIALMLYSAISHHLIFMCFVPWMQHFSYLCSFGLLMLYYPFVYLKLNSKEGN